MPKKINVVHIASEVSPFSKTGGLGDVTRSLPKALFRLGHKVSIITPLYGKLIDKKNSNLKLLYQDVNIVIDSENSLKVNFWQGQLINGLKVYFIENKEHFSKYKKVYVSRQDNIRFLVFNVAAIKLMSLLDEPFDIIHCHDWHTGLIPYLIKNNFRYTKSLKSAKTIFTIHNLAFQMNQSWYNVPLDKKDYGRKKLPHLNDPDLLNINFAKRAILSSDITNTVSERYREEIMTKKFGQDLHRILKNREDRLFGIINGIDYNAYNPQKDSGLSKIYSFDSAYLKKDNKKYLQKKLGLTIDEDVPMFCSTSRIAHQKGFDIIIKLLPYLLRLDIQMIFMGDGDADYIKKLKKIQKKYPKKMIWMPFWDNRDKETLLYAASDFFILPSHFEPCGINQMIAMRYGAIPIVRGVGGLSDTVDNFSPTTNKGTGFAFKLEDEFSFFGAIARALENYKYKKVWQELVVRAMKKSSSWEIPARKYIELYKKALRIKE
jgi:starch synthase